MYTMESDVDVCAWAAAGIAAKTAKHARAKIFMVNLSGRKTTPGLHGNPITL
jgi:hypothetical protein